MWLSLTDIWKLGQSMSKEEFQTESKVEICGDVGSFKNRSRCGLFIIKA